MNLKKSLNVFLTFLWIETKTVKSNKKSELSELCDGVSKLAINKNKPKRGIINHANTARVCDMNGLKKNTFFDNKKKEQVIKMIQRRKFSKFFAPFVLENGKNRNKTRKSDRNDSNIDKFGPDENFVTKEKEKTILHANNEDTKSCGMDSQMETSPGSENVDYGNSITDIDIYSVLDILIEESEILKTKMWKDKSIHYQKENTRLINKCNYLIRIINSLTEIPKKVVSEYIKRSNEKNVTVEDLLSLEACSSNFDSSEDLKNNERNGHSNNPEYENVPVGVYMDPTDEKKSEIIPTFYISNYPDSGFFLSFINSLFSIKKVRTYFSMIEFQDCQILLSKFKKFFTDHFVQFPYPEDGIDITYFYEEILSEKISFSRSQLQNQDCVFIFFEKVISIFREEEHLSTYKNQTDEGGIKFTSEENIYDGKNLNENLYRRFDSLDLHLKSKPNPSNIPQKNEATAFPLSSKNNPENNLFSKGNNIDHNNQKNRFFTYNSLFSNDERNETQVTCAITLTVIKNLSIQQHIINNYQNNIFNLGLGDYKFDSHDILFFNLHNPDISNKSYNSIRNTYTPEKTIEIDGNKYDLISYVVCTPDIRDGEEHFHTVVIKKGIFVNYGKIIRESKEKSYPEYITLLVYEKSEKQ